MSKFKRIIVFISIFIVVIACAVVLPVSKITNIRDKYNTYFSLGDNNAVYNNLNSIINSDVDQHYKINAMSVFTESAKLSVEQRSEFYKVILVFSISVAILIGIIGYLLINLIKDKKYIGIAFLTSAIASIIVILIYSFLIYMSMK